MVERLKDAINKARDERMRGGEASPQTRPASPSVPEGRVPLDAFRPAHVDPDILARNRVVTRSKNDPSHVVFDVLRTRMLGALRENGWRRVMITSPTKGCGKSTLCLNLAFSLARQEAVRTLLLDFDLRAPNLHNLIADRSEHDLRALLTGQRSMAEHFVRLGPNLVIGLNSRRVADSAEILQRASTARMIDAAVHDIGPDVVLFDSPPMLVSDDVISMFGMVDAVLLVVAGGQTKAQEVQQCERLMANQTNFLGVVFNRSEDTSVAEYAQSYA